MPARRGPRRQAIPVPALRGDPPGLLPIGRRRAGRPVPQVRGAVHRPAAGRAEGELPQLLR